MMFSMMVGFTIEMNHNYIIRAILMVIEIKETEGFGLTNTSDFNLSKPRVITFSFHWQTQWNETS